MERTASHAIDRLEALCREKQTRVCVGLDPRLAELPEELVQRYVRRWGRTREAAAAAFREFGRRVLEAVAPYAAAVKLQSAFYEEYGPAGIAALEETIRLARAAGLWVILDAKRGDIGSTAEAYSRAYLGEPELWGKERSAPAADALTVHPYLGEEGLLPFVETCRRRGRAVFVLVRTSNPGADRLQNLPVRWPEAASGGQNPGAGREARLYQVVAEWVAELGRGGRGRAGFTDVGAVVAGTAPQEAAHLRALLPETFFLVPGYGAQGAGPAEVKAAFAPGGTGAVVNSSRGLIFAYRREPYRELYRGEEFEPAVAEAARQMRDELNAALKG